MVGGGSPWDIWTRGLISWQPPLPPYGAVSGFGCFGLETDFRFQSLWLSSSELVTRVKERQNLQGHVKCYQHGKSFGWKSLFLPSLQMWDASRSLGPCLLASYSFFQFRKSSSSDKQVTKETFTGGSINGRFHNNRFWTNFILGLNVLVFIAQKASEGQLLLLGAKINSLIDGGQLWRLVTPSLLHANILHLLVNSYSLNAVGPTVEALSGSKRYIAIYAISAITGTTLSYFLCNAPSVGASGAIFGLVGSFAVFLLRHRDLLVRGNESLAQVGRVIALNLIFGLLTEGVDNWGHLGGLAGGAVVSWLIGPAYEIKIKNGKRVAVDHSPMYYLLGGKDNLDS